MICEKCQQKQATVHLQQYVNGTKTEIHLCQECSTQADMPVSFENLLQGIMDSFMSMASNKPNAPKTAMPTAKCPACGMTFGGIKESGKLGCAECYRTFAREIEAILKNVQGSTRHEGKYPHKSGAALFRKREAEKLRLMLSKAVEQEDYEEAAKLRDRIRALEVSS